MRNRNLWPELVGLFLILFIALGLLKTISIPSVIDSMRGITPTSAPAPADTPLPPAGTIYLKLPVEGIAQLDSFSNETFSGNPVLAQMVVVVKETSTTSGGGTVTRHKSEQFCVEVGAFLDEDGLRATRYDEKTAKHALLILKIEDLARYSEALPDQVQMYLVPDPACQGDS